MSELADAVTVVAAVTAATGVTAASAFVAARRVGQRLHDLSTVILGSPEREVAGIRIEAVPPIGDRIGAVAGRLDTIDQRLARHGDRLVRIEGEFEPDHGSSLRDRMDLVVEMTERLRAHVQLPAEQAHGRSI